MYLRRWTSMHYYDAMKYFRQTKHIAQQSSELLFDPPPTDYMKGYPTNNQEKNRINEGLVQALYQRYPDLKYLPLNPSKHGEWQAENIALKFLRKQTKLMDEGYSQQKAFDLTEQVFQREMQRRVDSQLVSRELASSNNARSFMSYYQQLSEYESRLRMRRAQRDQVLREMGDKELKEEVDEDIEEQSLNSIKEEQFSTYERTLVRVVESVEPDKRNNRELYDELQLRTKTLFQSYYKTASVRDRLSGLSDTQIQRSIMESPKKIKNQLQKVLQKLDKYGIYLNESRDIVVPDGTPRKIRELVQTPEFIQALMYRDIGYEQRHKSHIDSIQRRLFSLRQQYRQVREDNDVPVEMRKQNDERIRNVIKQTTINVPYQSTYKLFETQEERLLRLEIRWWERKSEMLEVQELENKLQSDPNPELEQQLKSRRQLINQRLDDVIHRLRYVKFKLEQENFKLTDRLLFQEHLDIAKQRNNFLNAGKALVEDTATYFNIPYEKRRITQSALENDDSITRLITRIPLEQGITELGGGKPEELLTDADITRYDRAAVAKRKVMEKTMLQKMRERTQRVVEEEDEDQDRLNEAEDEPDDEVRQDEEKLGQFVKRAKQYYGEIQKKEANDRKAKELELSKNKNLRKKKD